MEAEARKFIGGDVIPKITVLYALDQQISDEVVKLPLRSGDVLAPMQQGRQLGAVVLVGNEREGLGHSSKLLAGVTSLIPALSKP